jgi:putative thioredoxin
MVSQFIINVTEANFEYEVINYSNNIPVVVDFWAEWCVPCKMMDPILHKITKDHEGDFRLAKVNVDENQNLAIRYNVRGIPSIKAFRDGAIVAEISGVQSEPQIQEFLRDIIPSPADLNLDKANSLMESEKWLDAGKTFRQVLDDQPGNPNALLGLSKCHLATGRATEARNILNAFPVSREFASAEKLKPLAVILSQYQKSQTEPDTALELTYFHALRLVTRGNLPAAMDGILEVLRIDKNFHDGDAKQVILGLFEILGPQNPLTREYQSELALVLF